MSDTQQSPQDHLSNIHGNVRHFQWNDDYIELLSLKLGLQNVKKLVDIGSGLGGLPGLFGLYMKPGSTVYGYDLDPEAVKQAQAFSQAHPYSVKFQFEVADAHHLPLADGEADLVICQHVLAHVRDPQRVMAEMSRVTRPGGKVVAFEPNSMAQSLVNDSLADNYTLEERVRSVRYQYFYEAGKRAKGDGDDSIGDRLPGMFLAAGLTDIEVRLSDKSAALIPPYDTPEKHARLEELTGWSDSFNRNQAYIRDCFLAGGGIADEFEEFKRWELEQNARMREQIDRGEFIHPGGMVTYIVIGSKPQE
ncbi:MAG: SAM-dependent methyltransferase [Cyanobacteria bacterium RYN_339]|nr:SAM-dependent methyltransferase [Cyanobacteria bacterium RYN_339]